MKKISKVLSALALSMALAIGAASAAFAATVTFEGPEASSAFSIEDGTGYHATDLFEGLKNAMPGDSLTQDVTIKNAHSEAVKLYLSAIAHDEEGNPLEYSEAFEAADGKDQGQSPEAGDLVGGEGERDETVATMADFLSQLTMRVYSGSTLLYEGAPEGLPSTTLGEVASGDSLELRVELDVPASLGNEYAYRVGEVDWVITGEVPDPKLPETGPELPVTGDTAPVLVLAGIAVLAALVMLLAALKRRSSR